MGSHDQYLEPGILVRHPGQVDWGLGQVQSVADNLVTVNFENAGKVVIDRSVIRLDEVDDEGTGSGTG